LTSPSNLKSVGDRTALTDWNRADHVSGDQELQLATGADIYIHESAPVEYHHKDFKEGDVFELGAAKIEVLHTPGHTPNAISLLVTDMGRSVEPQMLLTGGRRGIRT
jgi:hydroxyacylglutathione hydrolase